MLQGGRQAFKMLKFGSEWPGHRIIFFIQTNHNEVSERHDLNISSPEKVDVLVTILMLR